MISSEEELQVEEPGWRLGYPDETNVEEEYGELRDAM